MVIDECLTYVSLKLEIAKLSMADAISRNNGTAELTLARGKLYTYRLAHKIISSGIFLNQQLLDKGLAIKA